MAKEKEEESLYDVDNIPSTENSAPALIEKAGITHNLKPSVALKEGDYKAEAYKGQKWHGFELTLTDPDGLQLTEVYFMPPTSEDQIHEKMKLKKYEMVEGKTAEVRDQTKHEMIRTLNNEFLAYLIDLGESFGFNANTVQEHLIKNSKGGFITVVNAFIDKFKPSEATRISAKLLYENNKNKETSYLKAHGSYCVYFPYGNDLFDMYKEGRPCILKLSKYETENKLKKLFANNSDAPKGQTQGVIKGEGFKAMATENDEDPF